MFFCNTLALAMTTRSLCLCSAFGSIVLFGCNLSSTHTLEPVAEQYISAPGSVGFDIEPLPSDSSAQLWLATFVSKGKMAKFRIELGAPNPLNDRESRKFDIQQGEGKFVSVPGSDASVLLADLKKSLEAKTLPVKVKRLSNLSFVFITLGMNESQAPGGGFNDQPRGNWTTMKMFIGEGEQEGDLFLNLNPVIKKGQFSIKDPDYGDIVLTHLARVL
jgi:hypothetical protein